jgi:aldose 1-epimerase
VEILELSRGRTRAVVIPAAGGRLHQLSIRDGDGWLSLLHAPADPRRALADPTGWSSYVMAPWPNRIDGGRFTFEGRLYEVPVNNGGHALHGRTLFQRWAVESRSSAACRLSVDIDAGWPFRARAVQEITLRDDGIDQRVEIRAERDRFPAGVGWHPWFRRDVRPGVEPRAFVDADRVYETHEMIPTGWLKPATGDLDLRGNPPLGSRRLDACYRHPRGDLRIRWGDIELAMRSSPNVTHAVVYTPPHAVCVEPQTAAIDAFNLDAQGIAGAGTVVVRPRQPLVAWTRWRWTIGR